MYNPIIVVGPGRCGTSAVAGVLHHLGVFMGEEFLPLEQCAGHMYWEDREFWRLSDELLGKKTISQAQWQERVQEIAERRRQLNAPWGWKDPRTSLIMPQCRAIFQNAKYIRCRRRAGDIEASMVKVSPEVGYTWESAIALRKTCESALDRDLVGCNVLEVHFRDLTKDRAGTVRRLIEFCQLTDVSEECIQAAVDSIRPG